MGNRIFSGLITLLMISNFGAVKLAAQEKIDKGSISGQVLDAVTREPIENVSVFLDNTTIGDVSDKNGEFLISNLAPGTYTVVVSMVGYHVINATLTLSSQMEIVRNFHLRPRPYQLNALEVTAEKPRNWEKNLNRFKRWFIGSSEFAGHCDILNPQYLNFVESPTGAFFARAEEPLKIDNEALGYKLHFILEDFKVGEREHFYLGHTQFVDLEPRDEDEARLWTKNRQIAYLGSLRHFLAEVIRGRSKDAGFVISVPVESEAEFVIFVQSAQNMKTDAPAIISNPITIETGPAPNQRRLSFPRHLKVEYVNEKAEKVYGAGDAQVSWIELMDASVVVDLNGNLQDPQSVRQYGYWAWKRVGDLLPRDYVSGSSLLSSTNYTPALDSLDKFVTTNQLDKMEGQLIVAALDELAFKSSLHDSVIAQLHRDIIDIMSHEDAEKWRQLKSNAEKGDFLRKFWLFRDLSFETKKNERLEEHYQRLRHARTFYSISKPGGYDGRGRIYIKYGEPDAKQVDIMPVWKDQDNFGRIRFVPGRSLETWSYLRDGRQLTYNFVDRIWGYLLVYHLDDILPAHLKESERRLILGEILRNRVDLDFRFAAMSSQGATTLAEFERAFNQTLIEQAYEHTQIPVSISNQFEDIYELRFVFSPAVFENVNGGQTLALAYGVRQDDLRSPKSEGTKSDNLEFLTVLRDIDLVDIATNKNSIAVDQAQFDEHGELIHLVQIPISERKFHVLGDISYRSGNQRGFTDYTIRNPEHSDRQLRISSVVFAKDIASGTAADRSDSTALIRNGLRIRMNPFSDLWIADSNFLYFEIYGLQRDASGRTQYDVEYTVRSVPKKGLSKLFGKINPFKKGKGSISVKTSQSGDKSEDFVFTKLDFTQLSKGEHILKVHIRDLVANEEREKESVFVLK